MKRFFGRTEELGQAMVEWAIVFPVFWLLLCGIIDVSWLGYQQVVFESAYQMTAWDFPLVLRGATGLPLSDQDIIDGVVPPVYSQNTPNVVPGNGYVYPLGQGIKEHIQFSVGSFLDGSNLRVEDATAVFTQKVSYETYLSGARFESYQIDVEIDASVKYTVKLLTPVGRIFLTDGSGEKVLEKKLVRKRTERVVVKRSIASPDP